VPEGDPEYALRAVLRGDDALSDADKALARAWRLGAEDYTPELEDAFEKLLPTLVEAGYAATEGHTWHFTGKGVERAEVIAPDRDVG
jgi:hypothetical protein